MAEKLIGKVTHYFNNLQVAVVKADKGSLAVGETVKFKHGDKEFVQTVDSLQVDKEPVKKIKKGEEVFYGKYAGRVPLVVKVNGKTEIPPDDEAFSPLTSSVEDAVRLGADAVGYTCYVGSPSQDKDFLQFNEVRRAEQLDPGAAEMLRELYI